MIKTVNNANHRIVYEIVKGKASVKEIAKGNGNIAKILGIGERNNLRIYKNVHKRKNN